MGVILRVGLISAAVLLMAPAFAGNDHHPAAGQSQSASPTGSGMPDASPEYSGDGSVINPDGDDSDAYSNDGSDDNGDDQDDDGGDNDDGLPPTNQI